MDDKLQLTMLQADLKLALLSFSADDFQLLNIAGNRLMSDSTFGPHRDFTLPGFFIKQIALQYLHLKPRLSDAEFAQAKSLGQKFMQVLPTFSPNAQQQLWADYHLYLAAANKLGFSHTDKDAYVEALDVTEAARQTLVQFLDRNRAVLADARTLLIKNLLAEFARIQHAHGTGLLDTITVCSLIALDRYYDYFCFRYANKDVHLDPDQVKKELYPYIDTIAKIQFPPAYDLISDYFFDLVKRWRESFIIYGELAMRMPPMPEERPLHLPEESKKKLGEVIGKALEKDLSDLKLPKQ